MTRRDWNIIARILREAKRPGPQQFCPEAPGEEWIRQRIVRAFCVEFKMHAEQDNAFCKAAGMPVKQERTFK
jgi:hypothetical protein